MTIFYFTATGNSLYIAKELDGTLYSIPQLLKRNETTFEDDVIGFVFPVYAFAAPEIVRQFVRSVKIKSNYTFAVATCGGRPIGCLKQFAKFAAEQKIHIDYAKSVKMATNYLPQYDMREIKAQDKNIQEQLSQIKSDITAREQKIEDGNAIVSWVSQIATASMIRGIYKKFMVKDTCNACGTCSKVCPRDNIRVEKTPQFGKTCEGCLGCANLCPQKAIIIRGEKNPDARFANDNVSLKEIIEANMQRERLA
jgi:Pyruvate/2-oxoacid:ferredoxin oxidoreductase delta subunit